MTNEKDATMFQPNNTELEVETLLAMLTYKRAAYSAGEEAFLDRFVRPYSEHPNVTDHWTDDSGNLFFEVNGGSKQLFTCHSDTVHGRSSYGKATVVPLTDKLVVEPAVENHHHQEVIYDANLMLIYKDDGEPLGADDGSGVWLCLEIIKAGLPCTIAIFRSEERGGVGSSNSARDAADFYREFDSAVAFDRRGTEDIITHQAGTRCCSDKFAEALADSLNKSGLSYKPCDGGIFTDTANLTHLIPECLNLSCGYFSEHSGDETQDVGHLFALRDAILKVDWAALPIERDPSVVEELPWSGFGYASGGWLTSKKSDGFMSSVDDDYDFRFRKSSPATKYESATSYDINDLYYMTLQEMVEAAAFFPDEFAEVVFRLLNEED